MVTREDVVAAACAVVDRDGPAALSMRRLADDLDVSYQVVYSRVGGKADVARAVHADAFARLASHARERLDDVATVAVAYLEFARDHPQLFELMFASPVPELRRDDRLRQVEWQCFRVCWLAAVERQLVHAPIDIDRLHVAWRLWTAVHGLTVTHLAGHPSPSGDVIADVRHLVAALLPPTPERP